MNSPAQGQLIMALRWQGTQLASLLQPLTKVTYRDDLSTIDFMPSKDTAIIFISEVDILSGGGYRRRVVKFRQSVNISSSASSDVSTVDAERLMVMVQNTPLTMQHFNGLQKFVNIDLGLTVIPVQSLKDTATLLSRMVRSETKIKSNPFRIKPREQSNPDQQLLASLTATVPGLGGQKARALLKRFGTLHALALAPREALEEVVGKAAGASVFEFFNGVA
ncbi:Fanconi anemia core complex-associated protein 24-like isoform X2 [Eriocheir sinensis]|nr:Fanconi anemia core complex-associated protein 24-like isoform X2 [Eriocheir sinensis]